MGVPGIEKPQEKATSTHLLLLLSEWVCVSLLLSYSTDISYRLLGPSTLDTPGIFQAISSTRLGLLRNPALWIASTFFTPPTPSLQMAIVGPPRPYGVNHSSKSSLFILSMHSIGSVTREKSAQYNRSVCLRVWLWSQLSTFKSLCWVAAQVI